MKRTLLILLASVVVAVTAQTLTNPQPVDWRYQITWDDPNLSGQVVSWTVYASNNVAVRFAQTRLLTMDAVSLLVGAPAGTYAVFTVARSALDDVSEPSTNHFVAWPGGNGRINSGKNIRVNK